MTTPQPRPSARERIDAEMGKPVPDFDERSSIKVLKAAIRVIEQGDAREDALREEVERLRRGWTDCVTACQIENARVEAITKSRDSWMRKWEIQEIRARSAETERDKLRERVRELEGQGAITEKECDDCQQLHRDIEHRDRRNRLDRMVQPFLEKMFLMSKMDFPDLTVLEFIEGVMRESDAYIAKSKP